MAYRLALSSLIGVACLCLACTDEPSVGGSGTGSGTETEGDTDTETDTEGSSSTGEIPFEPIPESEGPTRWASAYCDTLFACSCEFIPYVTLEECLQERRGWFELLQQQAQTDGLSYDADCVGRAVAVIQHRGCDPAGENDNACDNECTFYTGGKQTGQLCDWFQFGLSDCGSGLRCHNDTCFDACVLTQGVGVGQSCGAPSYLPCAEGSWCNFETEICDALPIAGESCMNTIECAAGSWCDNNTDPMNPVCVEIGGNGDLCSGHNQCESGYCPMGACVSRPGEGEACFDLCTGGLECKDGICGDPTPAICNAG